jgi:hypothetical protein
MENFIQDRSNNYQYNYRAETLKPLKNLPAIDRPSKYHISTQSLAKTIEIKELQKSSLLASGYQRRTEELPVHPNLESSQPWNSTTTVPRQSEMKNYLDLKTKKAKEWTMKKNKVLGGPISSGIPPYY